MKVSVLIKKQRFSSEDFSVHCCEMLGGITRYHYSFMVIMRCSVLTYSDILLSFTLGDILMIIFILWKCNAVLSYQIKD